MYVFFGNNNTRTPDTPVPQNNAFGAPKNPTVPPKDNRSTLISGTPVAPKNTLLNHMILFVFVNDAAFSGLALALFS